MAAQLSDVVLVVDDTPDALRLLTDVLDSTGMTVMVALDGQSALKIASRVKPDIVLMDAVMPGMDGFETCRQMKMLPGFENVPVIFMTGLTEPEHIVRGFQAGGADYVTKPLVIDAMLARIDAHLSNARKIAGAFTALDAAEQPLIAVDRQGRVLWFTPRAYRLIEQSFGEPGAHALQLPPGVMAWFRAQVAGPRSIGIGDDIVFGEGKRIGLVGKTDRDEILLRISDDASPDRIGAIKARFRLTQREAEVASWIAQGKSNRDVAAILSLSPRTVDKHLEVIFAKLGVENRTAATALLLRPTS